MLLTIQDIQKEIFELEGNKNEEKYYQLLHSAHSMALELGSHIGREICIGNNAFAPLNEKKYILQEYKLYKVVDGRHKRKYALTLIITVMDNNNEFLSFTYDYIEEISDELIYPTILKFHITTRTRAFDSYRDDSDYADSHPKGLNEEEQKLINEYGFEVRRFFLYD